MLIEQKVYKIMEFHKKKAPLGPCDVLSVALEPHNEDFFI